MKKWRKEAYHGTDYDLAQKIIEEGFKPNDNKEHWLGNGIYFFKDFALAVWWATSRHENYGAKIDTPCVIKVVLTADRDRVLDLRNIEDLQRFMEMKVCLDYKIDKDNITDEEYRCKLFDHLFEIYNIDIVVGCFDSKEKKYIDDVKVVDHVSGDVIEGLQKTLNDLKIMFCEVQYCVKKNRQSEIINIGEIEIINDKYQGA